MGFLDSLKEKALEASEIVKEKTTSVTEAIVDTTLKIKCATNWHAGEFNNEKGKPECLFSEVCPDCGKYITKTKHFFSEPPVIEDPNRCYGYRVCELCGFKQNDYFHNYEKAGKNEQCVIIERYSSCGHERFGKPEHERIHDREDDTFFKICRDCHIKIRVYE